MNPISSARCLLCFLVVIIVFQVVVPSLCSQCDQLFSFGRNDNGQLGDGTTTDSKFPVAVNTSGVLNGKTITAIAASGYHSLVLSSTGEVFSFGRGSHGQLGDGNETNSNVPVAVDTSGVLNGKTITAIAAGVYHSLVLSSTGEVFSFGGNQYGELGDGKESNSITPVAVSTSGVLNGKTITAIAAEWYHSLVLSSSGQVFSFGSNDYGQLGDGTNKEYSNIPVAVNTSGVLSGKTITAIAAGRYHSLALSSTGEVFGFGHNYYGQLGDGTGISSNIPVALNTSGVLNGKTITAIAAAGTHSLVLSSTGEVFSFGSNLYGQLGDGTNTHRLAPVAVSTSGVLSGKTIIAIAAGDSHSLVLSSTGQVFSFGWNEKGQLGDGPNTTSNIPVAVNISGVLNGATINAIAGGQYHSLVMRGALDNVTFDSPLPYLIIGQSNVAISWCGPGNVTIELIRDGSATIDTIVSNWEGGSPFIWSSVNASDAPRSDFRFQIKSSTYPSVCPTTSNRFEIDTAEKRIDSVNTPSPYLFNGQSNVSISWTSSGHLGNITIELIRDDDNETIDEIVSNWEGGSPFIWSSVNASDAPRSDFRFQIKSTTYPSVPPTTSNRFEIDTEEKKIQVITPSNGLEYLINETNVGISWTSQGHVGEFIKIKIFRRESCITITPNISIDSSPHIWQVNGFDGYSVEYFVRITSLEIPFVVGESSQFEIDTAEKSIDSVNTPSSYLFNGQSNVEISWTSSGHLGNITIALIRDGNATVDEIVSNWEGGSPFIWSSVNASGAPRSDFRFQIKSTTYPSVSPTKSNPFEIDTAEKRIDSVDTPSSYLIVGQSNVAISWASSGNLGNITIELIRDGDNATIDEIVSNWEGGSPFIWTNVSALDAPRSDFRFQIKSTTYPSVPPTTSNPFEIIKPQVNSSSLQSEFSLSSLPSISRSSHLEVEITVSAIVLAILAIIVLE